MTCPECNGQKFSVALVSHGGDNCNWEERPCPLCSGTGEIDELTMRLMEQGKEAGRVLKAQRLARNETMLVVANRLGVSVTEYSRMERGVAS